METQITDRFNQLCTWIHEYPGLDDAQLTVASADASFRSYYRVHGDGKTFIAMDAPPPQEDTRPFIAVTRLLQQADVRVPDIYAEDKERGFLLLDDFGDLQMLSVLAAENVDDYYLRSLEALQLIQQADSSTLPRYDNELLQREMQLFPDWFLQRHLGLDLSSRVQDSLAKVFDTLEQNALAQPQVFVHRDYHSRNLMVIDDGSPGIIDYQDAVQGPITYDLVSLLRDCYIDWPDARIEGWVNHFQRNLTDLSVSKSEFMQWFDLMGVQRHLKATGIFARLNHRDGKPGYLGDIPRTLNYVAKVSQRYSELRPLAELVQNLELSKRMTAILP